MSRLHIKASLVLMMTTLGTLAIATTEAGPSDAETRARRVLDQMIADGDTPGLQYLFVSADAVLYSYQAGMANRVDRVPVTDRTTFNAYSVIKTFTTAAILKLAEQGKLDIDEPIAKYLDRFPYDKSPTIRQTLSHTGGFPTPIPLSWVHLADEHAGFDRKKFLNDVLDKNSRLKSEPGESYAYSNVGYLLLGAVIEKVSGQPYTDYVEQQLIRPLALRDGETLAFTIAQPQTHARGYIKRWSLLNAVLGFFIDRDRFLDGQSGSWLQFRNFYANGAAYGGLIGNAHGLARYLQAWLSPGKLLSPASRELLFAPAHTRDGKALPRSVGWLIGALHGETYYAHIGGAAGYYCEIRLYPRLGRASVVMLNRTAAGHLHLLDRIDEGFVQDRPAKN